MSNNRNQKSLTKIPLPSTFSGTLSPSASAAIACLEGILRNEDFSHVYAENAVLHFPYAASIGWGSKIAGIEQIKDFIVNRLPTMFKDWKFNITDVYPSSDPNTCVLQWKASAIAIPTGKRYKQQYIAVVTVNDEGKIVQAQEFWNPKVVLDAFTK